MVLSPKARKRKRIDRRYSWRPARTLDQKGRVGVRIYILTFRYIADVRIDFRSPPFLQRLSPCGIRWRQVYNVPS